MLLYYTLICKKNQHVRLWVKKLSKGGRRHIKGVAIKMQPLSCGGGTNGNDPHFDNAIEVLGRSDLGLGMVIILVVF